MSWTEVSWFTDGSFEGNVARPQYFQIFCVVMEAIVKLQTIRVVSVVALFCVCAAVTHADDDFPPQSDSSIPTCLLELVDEGSSSRSALTKRWKSRSVVSVTSPTEDIVLGDPLSISVYAHTEELVRSLNRPNKLNLTVCLVAVDSDYVVTRFSSGSSSGNTLSLETTRTVPEKLDVGRYAVIAYLLASSGQEPLTVRSAVRKNFMIKARYDRAESKKLVEEAFASEGENEPTRSIKEVFRKVSIDDALLSAIEVPEGAITSLDLSYSKGVTKESVAWLAKQSNLKELKLDGSSIRANELFPLLALKNLSRIYFRNNETSSELDKAVITQFRGRGVSFYE